VIEPWPVIVERFRQKRGVDDGGFAAAVAGVETLATRIADGPLAACLFGWTSMHDLCIQQIDIAPYAGPYLRIAPQPSGLIDFRLIDTGIADRQWQRSVPPDAAPERMRLFLDQLGWTDRRTAETLTPPRR